MFTISTARDCRAIINKQCRLIANTLMVILMPSVAMATPTTIDFGSLDFSSANQGMWGAGSAPGLNIDRFIGTSWNSSTSVGHIYGELSSSSTDWPHWHWPSGWECHGLLCSSGHYHNPGHFHTHTTTLSTDTRSGARLDVNTSGRVGFQLGLTADSGSVDTDVQFNADLLVPDSAGLNVGQFFNLNPSSILAGGQLSTSFPQISANLDAIVGVRASIDNAQVCVLLSGCSAKSSTGELGFADQTIPLLSFNDPASPGQIKVLGVLDPTVFQFDDPISVGGKLNATVHVPDIATSAGVSGNILASSGADNLFTVTADLDALALAPLGLPGGGVEFNAGIFAVNADLIDVQAGPVLTIKQNFEFDPSLYVNLSFDQPVNIAGEYAPQEFITETTYGTVRECARRVDFVTGACPGNVFVYRQVVTGRTLVPLPRELAPQTSWFGQWNQLPDIALLNPETRITPTFSVQGNLLNNTLLGIDGLFDLNIMQASLALEKFGLSFDLGSVGPMYNYTRQSNLFDTPPLFSQSFGLGGFNSIVGNSFLVRTASAPSLGTKGSRNSVPEPAPLLLLLFGLVMMGVSRRKSARDNG